MSDRILCNMPIFASLTAVITGGLSHLHAEPELAKTLAIGGRTDIKVQGVVFASWMCFSPNGDWLALRHVLTDRSDRIQLWNCKTWENYYWDLDCKPDKLRLASRCAYDEKKNLLYYTSGSQVYAQTLPPSESTLVYNHPKGRTGAYSAVFRLDGEESLLTLVTDGADQLYLCTVKPGKASPEWVGTVKLEGTKPLRLVTAIDVAQDGSLIATGLERSIDAEDSSREYSIEIRTRSDGKRIFLGCGHRAWVNCVRITANDKSIISGSADGEVKVWDVASGRQVRSFIQDFSISSIDIQRSGRLMAYTSYEDSGHDNLYLVDMRLGKRVSACVADNKGLLQTVFHPKGNCLATYGAEGTVRIWKFENLSDN